MRFSTLLHLIAIGTAIAAPIDHVVRRSEALGSASSLPIQDNSHPWSPDTTLLSTDPPAQEQPNLRREITTQQSTPSSFPSPEAYQDPAKLAKLVPRSPFRGMLGRLNGAMKPKTPPGGIFQRMGGRTQSAPELVRPGSSGGLSRSNAMRRPTSAQSSPPTFSNMNPADIHKIKNVPAKKPIPNRTPAPGNSAPSNFDFNFQPKHEPGNGLGPQVPENKIPKPIPKGETGRRPNLVEHFD